MPPGSVSALRGAWATAGCPTPDELVGDWKAGFVRPLTHVAPVGLGLVGLPRWHGKRFRGTPTGVEGMNLVRAGGFGGVVETLPMTLRVGPSYADGGPAVVVTYRPDGPRPWRWVRDELRELEPGVLVGLTFVDLGPLRRLAGTPFLLSADDGASEDGDRSASGAAERASSSEPPSRRPRA